LVNKFAYILEFIEHRAQGKSAQGKGTALLSFSLPPKHQIPPNPTKWNPLFSCLLVFPSEWPQPGGLVVKSLLPPNHQNWIIFLLQQ